MSLRRRVMKKSPKISIELSWYRTENNQYYVEAVVTPASVTDPIVWTYGGWDSSGGKFYPMNTAMKQIAPHKIEIFNAYMLFGGLLVTATIGDVTAEIKCGGPLDVPLVSTN